MDREQDSDKHPQGQTWEQGLAASYGSRHNNDLINNDQKGLVNRDTELDSKTFSDAICKNFWNPFALKKSFFYKLTTLCTVKK